MLPQALPIFQAFCETSLAFDFYFGHLTFFCISKTKEILAALSACAQAVLLVWNTLTSYLAKSSLSSGPRSSWVSSMRPSMMVQRTGPVRAPPSCVLPLLSTPSTSTGGPRWPCHHFTRIGHNVLNKTIDCKSRVNPSLSFLPQCWL